VQRILIDEWPGKNNKRTIKIRHFKGGQKIEWNKKNKYYL
jgi:hypothetical protein